MTSEGGPALPTLRCPKCGSADLHFTAGDVVRCSRCRTKWTNTQLAREGGTAGHHSDREGKER